MNEKSYWNLILRQPTNKIKIADETTVALVKKTYVNKPNREDGMLECKKEMEIVRDHPSLYCCKSVRHFVFELNFSTEDNLFKGA